VGIIMKSLLLVCFLKFKQLRGRGWFQLEYSLIQVSNLIPKCQRWLIQNLDLIWHCCPFHLHLRGITPLLLILGLLRQFVLLLGYLKIPWANQSPKHYIVVAFSMRGSTWVTDSTLVQYSTSMTKRFGHGT
jgi:hypothetical protein